MTELLKKHYAIICQRAVEALNRNRFQAQYVKDSKEALAAALALIPAKATVGMGGSATLATLGIKETLLAQGNQVFNHQGLPSHEAMLVRRQELTADVFLASSNALTLEGELINVDGMGNRVAAMTFGPQRVILVVGANKIVPDEAAGRQHIELFAGPMNAERLDKKTPCRVTGSCMHCNSPERICMVTSIMHKAPMGADFHVIIVGEELGF